MLPRPEHDVMKLRLMPDPEVPPSTAYIAHVRAFAITMDEATLQSALEFHRMQVAVLTAEMRERFGASPRAMPSAVKSRIKEEENANV